MVGLPLDWNFATFKAYIDARFAESDLRYQQRYDASQKALETAMLAAEKAVQAALAAAEKAVLAASVAAEKNVQAALAAAEKAIEKAEAAQTAHNANTNEWRQTVNDITNRVAENARRDAEQAVTGLRETTALSIAALTGKLDDAVRMVDRREGTTRGIIETRTERRAEGGTMLAVISICIAVIGIAVGALLGFLVHH